MKASQVRSLSDEEMSEKLTALYRESFNLRFRNAVKQLENTARIREVRKDIARIKTIGQSRLKAGATRSSQDGGA